MARTMTDIELFNAIKETCGIDAVHDKMVEEMEELIEAMKDRKTHGGDHVREELADVYIVLLQMILIYGPPLVKDVMKYKLERTEKRLKEGKL